MKTGDIVSGFRFISEDRLDEYRSVGRRFVHIETGCDLYHIYNNETENLFSYIFKTVPENDKGVPHIMEHSVLAGSRNFPLKDPFIELLKSSMYTFLNAMTYPDKTVYPAASTVEADYFNLMKVYGDAVFFPLLRKETFMQEGIRFEKEDDKFLPKGIVFNEMKGSYSDHNSVLAEWSYRSLFPDNNYRFDSGGMPDEIKKLTYDEFTEFHRRCYHPSNCRIFLYGSIDTEKQLDFIQKNFLAGFKGRTDPPADILPQEKKGPFNLVKTSLSESGKGNTSITLNWLCGDSTDPVDALEMEILAEVLLGSSASPIYLDIINSGLGGDVSPVSGVDTDLRQIVFSAGIRKTEPEMGVKFKELVLGTLKRVVEEGLDRNLIEGSLRTAEFMNREIRGGRPFGLYLMDMACQGWLHGRDPVSTIGFKKWIKEIRQNLENDSRFFEKIIEKKLINNSHRSLVIVKPGEKNLTDRKDSFIPPFPDSELEKDMSLFENYQNSRDKEEEIKKIPVLKKSDIPLKIEKIDYTRRDLNNIDCYCHDYFTAGIVYTDILFDIREMDEDLKILVPLFSRTLRETGLPGIPFYDVTRELTLKTGGYFVFPEVGKGFDESINEFIIVRYKSLEERYGEATDLVFRILSNADFDDLKRLKEIVAELTNDFRASLLRRGNYVASLAASKKFSPSLNRQASWAGSEQVRFLAAVDTGERKNLEMISVKLKKIRDFMLKNADIKISLTAEDNSLDTSSSILSGYISRGNDRKDRGSSEYPAHYAETSSGKKQPYNALLIPSLVNFNAAVIRCSRTGTDEFVHEKLLSRIIDTGYLWEKVRMENGAYGVGATVNGMEGILTLSSYRDPSIASTQGFFRKSFEYIAGRNMTEDELFKAVISCVGKELKPLAPGEKGHINLRRIIYGLSDEIRQKNRDIMLKTALEDIVEAAERLYKNYDSVSLSTMCGREALEAYSDYFTGFSIEETVLPV